MASDERPLADDSDERLARVDAVLGEVAAQLRTGATVQADEIYAAHPDLARELRLVLPSVLKLEGAAKRAPDHLPPETIDRYRVLRELGRGGMGVVYEAEDPELGRNVAVKWISPHIAGEARYLERFRREAQAAARLSHEHVVPVYEVGECAGRPFFAMQLIDGHGLDALVSVYRGEEASGSARRAAWEFATRERSNAPSGESGKRGPRPALAPTGVPQLGRAYHRAVAQVILQVARALEYAHERGVLHRDVKPANILLGPDGRAFVADFGLAKVGDSGDMTREGDLIGTLRYMAPEQFEGHADARTDVYGLGLVLYEMLALRPAFQGNSREHLVQKALYERPKRLRAIRAEVPQDLERITAKAVAKIPQERYGTAQELAADLEAYLQGRPISARMPGVWYLARLAAARNRPLAWVLLAALVIVLVAVPTYVWQLSEKSRNEARLAYLGNLSGASAAVHSGDVAGARRRLEACASHLRGWAWRHLFARLDQSLRTLGRFPNPITELVVADGAPVVVHGRNLERLVDGTWEPILRDPDAGGRHAWSRAWRAPSGLRALDRSGDLWAIDPVDGPGSEPLVRIGGGHVVCSASSADGSTLAVFLFASGLRMVDADTGEALPGPEAMGQAPEALALSADGTQLYCVTTSGEVLRSSGGSWQTLHHGAAPLHTLALSADESRLAVSGVQNSVLVLDTLDGRVLHTLVGHTGSVRALAFGPDGRQLYSAGWDTAIRVWDLERGELRRTLAGHARRISALAADPDGERLYSGSLGGGVKEWDVRCAGGLAHFVGMVRDVGALDISADGAQVATGDRAGTVRIYDLASESLDALMLGHRRAVSTVRFHAAGLVSTGYDGQVIAWDSLRGVRRWSMELGEQGIALEIDGERGLVYVATTERSVVVLGLEDGVEHRRLRVDPPSTLRSLALGPAGDAVWLGKRDGTLLVLDAADLSFLRSWSAHSEGVESIGFDPTGRTFVTASADGSLARWDAQQGTLLFRRVLESAGAAGESDELSDARFSPDGERIAVAAHGELIRLVTADGGAPLLDLAGHTDWVLAVAFTPDGEQLVSTDSDASLRTWGTRSTAEKREALRARARVEEAGRLALEAALGGPLDSVSTIDEALSSLTDPAALLHVHHFRAAHLLESFADIVLRDPSRSSEVENYLSQLELQRAARPEAPTLAAVLELARGDPGLALARAELARGRMGTRPDPLLTLIEARAQHLLGEEAEASASLARVEDELRSPHSEVSAVRIALVEEWLARWR